MWCDCKLITYFLLVTLISLYSPRTVAAVQPDACTVPATPVATPADANMFTESVELEDGFGLLWPGGDRGVLLLHGAAYDAASWEPQAQILVSAGYSVLAVEELDASAIADSADVLLETCDVTGYAVVGASAGGAAGLDFLSVDQDSVTGLILLGTTGDVSMLGAYPKLFVASEGEGLAGQLTDMKNSASGVANDVLILPGADHAQATFTGDQGDLLTDAILEFLDETVTW